MIVMMASAVEASPGPTPLAESSTIPAPKDTPYPGTIALTVDTSDLAHRIYKVPEQIPVTAGDVVLFYPRWLPGTHAPEGPIDRFAALAVTARGARLAWTRDVLDTYAFHVAVPAGVTTIGMKVLAVDGVAYDGGRSTGAVERSTKTKAPIELILTQGEVFETARLDYHAGLRYPHLVRDPAKPALLDEILAPRK